MKSLYEQIVFLGCLLSLSAWGQSTAAQAATKVLQNVSYGASSAQIMDIYC